MVLVVKKKKQNEMGNVLYEIRQLSTFTTLSVNLISIYFGSFTTRTIYISVGLFICR